MKALQRWFKRHHTTRRRAPGAAVLHRRAEAASPESPASADDDHARVCGWFDSSHELRCGLLVQEAPELAVLAPAWALLAQSPLAQPSLGR